jgi:hypothetical protein
MSWTETLIKLIEHGAWPLVALVAIIVLGPLGYLEKAMAAFASAAQNLIGGIKEAKDNLVRVSNEAREFSLNTADLQTLLGKINQDISELNIRTRAISEDLETRSQIDLQKSKEDVEENFGGSSDDAHDFKGDYASLVNDDVVANDPELMLTEMVNSWIDILQCLEDFGGRKFDARAVGQFAFSLTHKNRKKPLSSSQAELIARLHGEYKSFTRRRSTAKSWLTPEIYRDFMDSAKLAKQVLSKV